MFCLRQYLHALGLSLPVRATFELQRLARPIESQPRHPLAAINSFPFQVHAVRP